MLFPGPNKFTLFWQVGSVIISDSNLVLRPYVICDKVNLKTVKPEIAQPSRDRVPQIMDADVVQASH
jgi:hypothetical protein